MRFWPVQGVSNIEREISESEASANNYPTRKLTLTALSLNAGNCWICNKRENDWEVGIPWIKVFALLLQTIFANISSLNPSCHKIDTESGSEFCLRTKQVISALFSDKIWQAETPTSIDTTELGERLGNSEMETDKLLKQDVVLSNETEATRLKSAQKSKFNTNTKQFAHLPALDSTEVVQKQTNNKSKKHHNADIMTRKMREWRKSLKNAGKNIDSSISASHWNWVLENSKKQKRALRGEENVTRASRRAKTWDWMGASEHLSNFDYSRMKHSYGCPSLLRSSRLCVHCACTKKQGASRIKFWTKRPWN